MGRYITIGLFFILLLCSFSPSALGEERLTARGDTMRVLRQEDLMILEGNVLLKYRDLTVSADWVEFFMEENIFVAKGNVRLKEGGQLIECQEVRYHLDEKTSIFVEAKARFHDEDTLEDLFFFSPYIEGDGEKYQISMADLTPCKLDKPHIFFRAQEVEVYPGDYLIATNVVFWELGGLLPLFYWPILYLSLEEDQDIIPSFGYSREKGWFMKLAYHYFEEDFRGTIYLDYYSITGLGTGLRHFYLDQGEDEGFFYLYMQENREKESGWDFFKAQLTHRQLIEDWRTTITTDYSFFPEDRQILKLSLNTNTQLQNSRLDYRGDFEGQNRLPTDDWSRSLISRCNYRLSLPLNSVLNLKMDHRLLEDGEGFFSLYEGEGTLTQRGTAYTLDLLVKRDRPTHYRRDALPRFITLPELNLTLTPGRLYLFTPTVNRYLNPFRLGGVLGHYQETASDTTGFKILGEYRYQQTFRPLSPLTINVSHQGQTSLYFTQGEIPADNLLEVSDTRVRTGLVPFTGFNFSLDYNRRHVEGASPFSFDRVSPREDLGGQLAYSWRTGRARLSSTYSLLTEKYGDLKGDLTLTPLKEVRMEVSATYSLEDKAFKGLVATSRLQYEKVKYDMAIKVDREWEVVQVDGELLWEVGPIELGLRTRYHPKDQDFKRGELVVIWDLHCRQLSLSYDHLKEEYWLQYSIPAFPGQKASLGRTPDDPMLFDLDLGGIFDG